MTTRLKLAREALGFRAYEIARAVGITRTQFSLIEGGHVLPAPWLAARIAAVFGLDPGDLFEEGTNEQGDEGADAGGSGEGVANASGLRSGRRCGPTEGGTREPVRPEPVRQR